MDSPIQLLLNRFPKKRDPLPAEYQEIYNLHYERNRKGQTNMTSLSSRLERWLHRTVAADVVAGGTDPQTLEIGAGTLNHLPYEPGITHYDVVEPSAHLFQCGQDHHRVRTRFQDIGEVDLAAKYDRILAIATFEHVTNLPEVVARSAFLLRPGGSLRVSIPNEGTLFWKLGTLLTGYEFRKMYGLDYQLLMRHEHVNTAAEIEGILHYFFARLKARSFGIHKKLAFYRFFECKEPNLERVGSYLKTLKEHG